MSGPNPLDEALEEALLTPYEEPITPTWQRLMEALAKRDLIVAPRGMFRDAYRWMYWLDEPSVAERERWLTKARQLLAMGDLVCPWCQHPKAAHDGTGACRGCHA